MTKIVVFGGPRGVRNGTFPTFYNDLTKKTRGPKKPRFSEANMRSKNFIYVTRRAQDASGDDPRGIFFESKFDLNIEDFSDRIFIDF